MPQDAQIFHNQRRAFIIMRDAGLLIAHKNSSISHQEMLKNIGIPQKDITKFLTIYPRGYFLDGELCCYQGYDMTPGAKWELSADGRKIIQKYITDLRAVFCLNDETPVYTGVIVGEIGDVWEKINKTTLKTLENRNIVM